MVCCVSLPVKCFLGGPEQKQAVKDQLPSVAICGAGNAHMTLLLRRVLLPLLQRVWAQFAMYALPSEHPSPRTSCTVTFV